jgi:hypothetical protein
VRDKSEFQLASLSPEQRAEHYRQLAKKALLRAARVPDQHVKADYLALAANWHAMAEEMDRAARQAAGYPTGVLNQTIPGQTSEG